MYEYKLDGTDEIPMVPCNVNDIVVRPLYIPTMTIFEYEAWGRDAFDFPSHPHAQEYKREPGISRGMLIFYATSGRDFVHRTGVALSARGGTAYERVWRRIRHPSYPLSCLDDGHTVYGAFSLTDAKYRRKGVYAHVYSKVHRYLKDKGFSRIISLAMEDVAAGIRIRESEGANPFLRVYVITLLTLFDFMWVRPCTKSPLVESGISS